MIVEVPACYWILNSLTLSTARQLSHAGGQHKGPEAQRSQSGGIADRIKRDKRQQATDQDRLRAKAGEIAVDAAQHRAAGEFLTNKLPYRT